MEGNKEFRLSGNGWYVNADNDRCEVALLNGVWAGVYKFKKGGKLICVFDETGFCKSWILVDVPIAHRHVPSPTEERCNITAAFEGWESNPFEGAPSEFTWVGQNLNGSITYFDKEPSCNAPFGYWLAANETADDLRTPVKYIGDWRNSLVRRADFEGEK